jgi:hypothetical protein
MSITTKKFLWNWVEVKKAGVDEKTFGYVNFLTSFKVGKRAP